MRRIVPDAPAWLAAVGAYGDLGAEGLALPEAAEARRAAVRKLTSLVNAPRRVPDGPVRTALQILLDHEDAREALTDPRVGELEEAKRAYKAELDRVIRTPPVVHGDVALVRFSSPYQVHTLVATTWARRMDQRVVVIAANDDYLPGRVNFAMRGGDGSLLARLRAALPAGVDAEAGHGHDRATGGSLAPADFEGLLRGLGMGAHRPDAAA